VLLERTPYDKAAPSRSERTAAVGAPRSREEVAAYFVEHGYAVAYQDCRGRYRSGGQFTKYLSDPADGCDTLGRVDGFDQDERARKRDEGSEVLRGLLAA
jgi:predicted acyl esterase